MCTYLGSFLLRLPYTYPELCKHPYQACFHGRAPPTPDQTPRDWFLGHTYGVITAEWQATYYDDGARFARLVEVRPSFRVESRDREQLKHHVQGIHC